MADEIKLETEQKSVKIDCVLSFRRSAIDASFDYNLVILITFLRLMSLVMVHV